MPECYFLLRAAVQFTTTVIGVFATAPVALVPSGRGGEESLAVGRDIEGVPVPCVAWSGRAPNGDCLEMTYVVRRQGFDSMYIRVTFDDDDRMTDDLRSTLL